MNTSTCVVEIMSNSDKRMTSEQKEVHIKAFVAELSEEIRAQLVVGGTYATLKCDDYRTLVEAFVTQTETSYEWNPSYILKVKPTHWTDAKNKYFRQHKTGKFNYKAAAQYFSKIVTDFWALEKRREKGRSLAETRVAALQDAFKSDHLLSELKLTISSEPESRTETGAVEVEVASNDGGPREAATVWTSHGHWRKVELLTYNGKTFSGDLRLRNVSVVRVQQLNVLELIPLASDSILGPSINAMLAAQEAAHEKDA